MSTEKQFEPSSSKLKKARKDGDIAKSKELSGTIACLLGFLIIYMLLSGSYTFVGIFEHFISLQSHLNENAMLELMEESLVLAVIWCLPVMLVSFATVFFIEALQVGFTWSPRLLVPDLSRLNPVEGIKRMIGADKNAGGLLNILVEVSRGFFFVICIISITLCFGYLFVSKLLMSAVDLLANVETFYAAFWQLVFFILVSSLLICIVDFIYQRAKRRKRLRMDIEEFRRELKDTEGSAEIKNMRKQLHQEVLLHGILEDVRKARVVIVGEEEVVF